jgi:hypothetical protein
MATKMIYLTKAYFRTLFFSASFLFIVRTGKFEISDWSYVWAILCISSVFDLEWKLARNKKNVPGVERSA